jgi:hypothetical protein
MGSTTMGCSAGRIMKYLCLVYHEEQKLAALSHEQMDALVAGCIEWVGDLEKSGHHIMSGGLQTIATAATVRSRGGKLSVTDGPFAETKEFLSGFIMIQARDLNEAIQLASKFPGAAIGSVEVRPVLEADEQPTEALDKQIADSFRRAGAALAPNVALRIASVPQPTAGGA